MYTIAFYRYSLLGAQTGSGADKKDNDWRPFINKHY